MSETITYLEIDDPAELREPEEAPRVDHEIERADDPGLNRWLYEEIGAPHEWVDRLSWTEGMWKRYAAGIETYVVRVEGQPAAYLELKPGRGSAQIAILGVRRQFQGLGLGAALLVFGVRRGFELAERVWLSTNSMDAEHALANYEARGLRPFRRERMR